MTAKPGERPGGRQKGTPNKMNRQAKEAIALAAEKLGGHKRLAAWAKEAPENEKVFWSTIYPKLVPVAVGGDADGAPLNHKVEVVFVAATPQPE